MLVFIDESGDAGFKMAKGSSPNFVISMVIFESTSQASAAHAAIATLRQSLKIQPEWKFNKVCDDYKDAFFEMASELEFSTRSLVVRKELIDDQQLRSVPENFYKHFIREMIDHDQGVLTNANIIIDGSGDRVFKREFAGYLRKNVKAGVIKNLQLKDSTKDPLLQLADMVAGAVARSYRTDRPNARRWRNALRNAGKIDNVWEFK